jgi:DNA polymerase II small subunit
MSDEKILAGPEALDDIADIRKQDNAPVDILYSYDREPKEWTANDFTTYFTKRYEALSNMLKGRSELNKLTSIQRVIAKDDRDRVSVIGMITNKYKTRNDHIMLTVEDQTGEIKVLINKNNRELIDDAHDLVHDEVLGITGDCGDDIIFADTITYPDIPLGRPLKKSPNQEYAVFISDVEIGSHNFLKDEFERFIHWIRGDAGNDNLKRIQDNVKYLFIVGDLVAGVGVYPGQEEELNMPDIEEQFRAFEHYMDLIPDDIQIIICPGNHDAGRITEPQPPQRKDFTEAFQNKDNVHLVSSPSTVRIGRTPSFDGFTVQLYHGYSMPYYADVVDTIRNAGGQDRSDLIMEFYLKRRHLAPAHTSTMYLPDPDHDPLVIKHVPDILATGHIHRTAVGQYRSCSLLNCSAWTKPTEYQKKRGLNPQPGRSIIMNLHTRKVKVVNFWQ